MGNPRSEHTWLEFKLGSLNHEKEGIPARSMAFYYMLNLGILQLLSFKLTKM